MAFRSHLDNSIISPSRHWHQLVFLNTVQIFPGFDMMPKFALSSAHVFLFDVINGIYTSCMNDLEKCLITVHLGENLFSFLPLTQ